VQRDDLALRLRVGTAWALRGARAKAELHLHRVVREDAGNRRNLAARALLALGKHLYLRSLGDGHAALRTLRTLRVRFPAAPEAEDALFPLARALVRQDRTKDALMLLATHATGAEGHGRVAWLCLTENVALDRGIHHARRAAALTPSDAKIWSTLARLYERRGPIDSALRAWTRAVSLDSKNRWFRRERDRVRRLAAKDRHPTRSAR
jgi:thioredoxin-like negative regulator of GroEL